MEIQGQRLRSPELQFFRRSSKWLISIEPRITSITLRRRMQPMEGAAAAAGSRRGASGAGE